MEFFLHGLVQAFHVLSGFCVMLDLVDASREDSSTRLLVGASSPLMQSACSRTSSIRRTRHCVPTSLQCQQILRRVLEWTCCGTDRYEKKERLYVGKERRNMCCAAVSGEISAGYGLDIGLHVLKLQTVLPAGLSQLCGHSLFKSVLTDRHHHRLPAFASPCNGHCTPCFSYPMSPM